MKSCSPPHFGQEYWSYNGSPNMGQSEMFFWVPANAGVTSIQPKVVQKINRSRRVEHSCLKLSRLAAWAPKPHRDDQTEVTGLHDPWGNILFV